jgi:hypothetical protein
MLKSRVFAMVISGLLGGCVTLGPPSGASTSGTIDSGTSGITSGAAKVQLSGIVSVPNLISNNANNLVGNNANALISNNANSLVGNNANAFTGYFPAFRGVQALEQSPLAGMKVAAFSDALRQVSDVATTDDKGRYALSVPTGTLLIEATRGKIREMAIVQAGGASATGNLDAGSTFAAVAVKGSGAAYSKFSKDDVASLATAISGALTDAALNALVGAESDIKSALEGLKSGNSSVKSAVDKLLAATTGGSSGSGSGSSGGSTGTSGTGGTGGSGSGSTTKVKSTISVGDWPVLAGYKKSEGGTSFLRAAQDSPDAPFPKLIHTGPNIKKGDVVRVKMRVTAAEEQSPSTYPSYVKFLNGTTVVAKIGMHLGTPAGSPAGYPSCESKAATVLTCGSTTADFMTFEFTAAEDVSSIEFGGETKRYTADLTAIEINP